MNNETTMNNAPLKVDVETKDGRTRSVVLCRDTENIVGHSDSSVTFKTIDWTISYYFEDSQASDPDDLIWLSVFGEVEEDGDVITKVISVDTLTVPLKADPVFVTLSFTDVSVPLKEAERVQQISDESYIVGYTDEDGNECDEDGNYI